MVRKKPAIEWIFLAEGERDGAWPPVPQELSAQTEPGAQPVYRRTILFSVTITVLLVVGIGMAYAYHEAMQGIRALEQDVQSAVEVDEWIQQNRPKLLADTRVDDEPLSYWTWSVEQEQRLVDTEKGGRGPTPDLHIQDMRFSYGTAVAELTLARPALDGGTAEVYRQTRFYRETDNGWLRTRPDPMLWGQPESMETHHLIWRYRQRDQAAVAEIADQMDALYVALQQDYGLAQPLQEDRLVIDVQVDYVPGEMSSYFLPSQSDALAPHGSAHGMPSQSSPMLSHLIDVPSPSTYLAAATLTDAEILAQTVALALLKAVWEQAVVQHGIGQTWPVGAGVRLWQIWDMDLSFSQWREDIVQWVYADAVSTAGDAEITLPARYHELCAAFTLRMIEPSLIGIPLYCDHKDSQPLLNSALLSDLRRSSLDSFNGVSGYQSNQWDIRLGKPMIVFTAIDYAVTAYGRERLPALVAALGEYNDWETLVPAVYGVPLDEFEQGWQQHVADRIAGTQYHLVQ